MNSTKNKNTPKREHKGVEKLYIPKKSNKNTANKKAKSKNKGQKNFKKKFKSRGPPKPVFINTKNGMSRVNGAVDKAPEKYETSVLWPEMGKNARIPTTFAPPTALYK